MKMLQTQAQTKEFLDLSNSKSLGKLNAFFNERLVSFRL
jgi:hypothetical protein